MKIYDCFPFFNELDTVEIRFAELYDTVDQFVLVEAPVTHSGHPKPLHFQDNIERFAPYRDKIRHIVVENMPTDKDHWVRERFQRDQIVRVLNSCSDDDLIIISDCDEISRAGAIKDMLQLEHGQVAHLVHKVSQYYYNLRGRQPWRMGKACRYSTFKQYSNASEIRNTNTGIHIENAGWHFSYMGGLDKVIEKLKSFAHQELNTPDLMNLNHVRANANSGFSTWDRNTQQDGCTDPYWKFFPVDENADLPSHIVTNKDRFGIADVEYTEYRYDMGNLKLMGTLALSVAESPGKIISIGNHEGQATIHLANMVYPQTVFAFDEAPNTNFVRNVLALTSGNIQHTINDAINLLENVEGLVKFLHLDVPVEALGPVIDATRAKLHGVLCGYGYNDHVSTVLAERFPTWEVSGQFWHITFTP